MKDSGEKGAGCEKNVKVVCKDGKEFSSDYVIVTSSIGYLKKHEDSMFCPRLPKTQRNAVHQMGFDTIAKIFLIWDQPLDEEVLEKKLEGIQMLWVDGAKVVPSADRTSIKTKVKVMYQYDYVCDVKNVNR